MTTVRLSRILGSAVARLKKTCLCLLFVVTFSVGGFGATNSTNSSAKAPLNTAVEEKFDALRAGTNLYLKVTVLNKTRNDLFISHAQGMASIKVRDLDIPTQLKLGYQVEPPKQTAVQKAMQAAALTQIEEDPRVQQALEELARRVEPYLYLLDEQVIQAIVACVVLSYLLFSFLCRCICVKTSNPPSPLIWLPFFKQIPLFKAAGMPGWWILSNFFPPLFLIAYILWAIKIAQSRGKNIIWGVMLLLPLTNLLAFLYLALSTDGRIKPTNKNVISLQSTPRKQAA